MTILKNKFGTHTFIHNIFILAVFLCTIIFGHTHSLNAQVETVNAGLSSDIWFSKVQMEYDSDVSIFSSVQNTSNQKITGTASFWINDAKIHATPFEVEHGMLAKLEAPWKTSVGEFVIRVTIDEIKVNGEVVAIDRLISREASLEVKIKRKLDVEYIKEIGGNVLNTTIQYVNTATSAASNSLEGLKAPVANLGATQNATNTSEQLPSTSNSAQNNSQTPTEQSVHGEVAGESYESEDGQVLGWESSSLGDTVRNGAISFIQLMLKYWYFFFPILVVFILYLMLRRRED
jgi:hypothetical protein